MRTKEELLKDLKIYAGRFDEIRAKIDDLCTMRWVYNPYYLCGYLQRYIEEINIYSDMYYRAINEDAIGLDVIPPDYETYIVRFLCYVTCDGNLSIEKRYRCVMRMTRRNRLSLGSTLAMQFECEDTKLISLFQTFTTKISFFETKK